MSTASQAMPGSTATYAPLPDGIRSRYFERVNGLRIHALEAGDSGHPVVLLLHGFPELSYSWRKVMLPLAEAGYYVLAPDQRGYGLTTGWHARYDDDLAPFRIPNLVRDVLGIVAALGHKSIPAVVGHDFGSPVAAWCSIIRPDVFRSVALMSAPFGGTPPFESAKSDPVHAEMAALARPRKHYQWYYSTREADADMRDAPQGIHDFLRAYYHAKSADWPANKPCRLASWSAGELAKLPTYYIMDLDKDMAATVAPEMPSKDSVAACKWLPDDELRVYSEAFARTGFQGGLQWYRCGTEPRFAAELETWSGRTIDTPSMFIAGASDWGIYQRPGAFERMQSAACTKMLGCHLVPGAGHWVQQEQPQATADLLLDFLESAELANG
jgi:pimeloyl-ACP methyl ester carboxylesterase